MSLVEFAKKELELLGNGEEFDKHILQIVEIFANEGHSGFSASYAISVIEHVLSFKPLAPLTGSDDEWNEVADNLWQNKRCGGVFKDAQKAWYIDGKAFSDDGGKTWYTNKDSFIDVVFPFSPPLKPEYIILK